MVLPAPVSPLMTLSPGENVRLALSMTARFSMWSSASKGYPAGWMKRSRRVR